MDTIFNLKRANVDPDAPYMLTASHIGIKGSVEDVSINLKKGELMGFAGLLGSGRTETAEMLWLIYFNQTLFEKGLISETERNRMKLRMEARRPSAFGKNGR